MSFLLAILVTLAGLYVVLLFVLAWVTVHPPRIPLFLSPGALGLPQEPVQWTSKDGVPIRGWWMHQDEPTVVAVLAHGYLMNRAEPIPMAKRFHEAGMACLVFDFRRHGGSGGKRCTIGWDERHDVAAAVGVAKERYPNAKLVLWGSSMGGAASAFAVAHEGASPDTLILDSVYGRLADSNRGWWLTFVGKFWTPFLLPVSFFARMLTGHDPKRVDVRQALTQIQTPTLLLHGSHDLIAPLTVAEANAAAAPNGKLVVFEGVQHSQPRWLMTERYDQEVFAFLRENGICP